MRDSRAERAYSAGFSWGDGDYFHWVPSPQTDVSQGIGMGSGTGPGYFQPEALDSASGDVENLEMSFNAARVWKPTQVVEVMAHAASYLARRLDGKVVGPDGKPFDASAAQAKVAAIERALTARGVVPGSELACQLFLKVLTEDRSSRPPGRQASRTARARVRPPAVAIGVGTGATCRTKGTTSGSKPSVDGSDSLLLSERARRLSSCAMMPTRGSPPR